MTQKTALKIMLSGANVFLTGAPGAGKTYVLNDFIETARDEGKHVAVTASTGIAASHIGGTTIHSWSGTGIKEMISKEDLQGYAANKRLRKRYNKADILVIDEVSMLHGTRLDMVNIIAKKLRGNKQPFGGLQVILVGDLFQLPPVSRDTPKFDFAYKSYAWENLHLKICYLTEQHRQEGNDSLLGILEAMRQGNLTDSHKATLSARLKAHADPKMVTRLYSHNIDVDTINQEHLDAIKSKPHFYNMVVDGNDYLVQTLKKNVLAPEKLELKVGAEVMFVANNFSEGFVNGTRGTVKKFTKAGDPVIKLKTGRSLVVEPHTWSIKEDERVLASVEQMPLRLAWAITIHKSQGMSLDSAEVDLSKAFQPAMGYVALSRIRSLDGLYLQGINEMALMMHEDIYELDVQLREAST